jgi:uncharacterized protein (TIGR02996 family)
VAKNREQEAFLKALKKNEDDLTTRMVYADWLDDRGEHEESDRQRKWPAANEWLVAFVKEYNADKDEDDEYDSPITYEELIRMGHEGLSEGSVFCGGSYSLCEALEGVSRDFWKNWSIVTGVPVSDDTADGIGYRCAC